MAVHFGGPIKGGSCRTLTGCLLGEWYTNCQTDRIDSEGLETYTRLHYCDEATTECGRPFLLVIAYGAYLCMQAYIISTQICLVCWLRRRPRATLLAGGRPWDLAKTGGPDEVNRFN